MGWSITICSAVALFAIESGRPAMYAVGIAVAAGFWTLDAYAKTIQRIFIDRVRVIEEFMHGGGLDRACRDQSLNSLGWDAIGSAFGKRQRAPVLRLAAEMRLFGSYFLYLSLIALMLVLLLIEVAE